MHTQVAQTIYRVAVDTNRFDFSQNEFETRLAKKSNSGGTVNVFREILTLLSYIEWTQRQLWTSLHLLTSFCLPITALLLVLWCVLSILSCYLFTLVLAFPLFTIASFFNGRCTAPTTTVCLLLIFLQDTTKDVDVNHYLRNK